MCRGAYRHIGIFEFFRESASFARTSLEPRRRPGRRALAGRAARCRVAVGQSSGSPNAIANTNSPQLPIHIPTRLSAERLFSPALSRYSTYSHRSSPKSQKWQINSYLASNQQSRRTTRLFVCFTSLSLKIILGARWAIGIIIHGWCNRGVPFTTSTTL